MAITIHLGLYNIQENEGGTKEQAKTKKGIERKENISIG